jgi:hypothetical protein
MDPLINPDDWGYLTYTPWDPSTPCGELDDPYLCGAVIPNIYWVLQHNTLRVGFGGPYGQGLRLAGDLILYQSSYVPSQLANVAFTYAIATLPDGYTVADFFNRVSERYYQFMVDGWINGEENHRLNQALTVHCVGWSGWICNSSAWHRTASQLRPAWYTAKSSFGFGHTSHFVRADTMSRIGTPTVISFGTSGDGYAYIQLDSSGDEICALINYPWTATYGLHAAVRSLSSSHDQVQAKIEPNGYQVWTDSFFGDWEWSHNGPSFPVTAGQHQTCLKRSGTDNLQIDALWVTKL